MKYIPLQCDLQTVDKKDEINIGNEYINRQSRC